MSEPVLSKRQEALRAKAKAQKAFQDLFIRASQMGFRSVYANRRRGKRYDTWYGVTTKMEKADITLLLEREGNDVMIHVQWGFRRSISGAVVEPIERRIYIDKVIPTSAPLNRMTSLGVSLEHALSIIDAFSSPDMSTALMGMPIFEEYIDLRLRRT